MTAWKKPSGGGEINLTREGYELKFLGKSYAKYLTSTETETVVVPDLDHNSQPENKDSENLYIVGDNLDALKHLLGSYAGQVKCIYIDPPYNTGSDGFVYNDDFGFTPAKLVEKIGLSEEEAARVLDLQGKSSHSAWLTFMYPRLQLAKELLSDDGVIFISIDDNEQSNIKLLCDEVFGEQNYVDTLVWKGKGGGQDSSFYVKLYESILCYTKNITQFTLSTYEVKQNASSYVFYDEEKKLKYKRQLARKWGSNARREDRPNLYFSVTAPDGTEVYPHLPDGTDGSWRHNKLRLQLEIERGEFEFVKNSENEWVLYQKVYASEDGTESKKYTNIIDDAPAGTGSRRIKELFAGLNYFEYPKPAVLIQKLISMINDDGFTVIDFFSGSGTAADAVMQLNAEDGGNRRYIMAQLPEQIDSKKPAYEAGYRTIDEIGRDRIKRAATKIKNETDADIDYGFRLYRLEEPSGQVLDQLERFDPAASDALFDGDYVSKFDLNGTPGHDTVLATWLVKDGYGLTASAEKVKLENYELDVCGDSGYIINAGLTSDDVLALVRLLETGDLRLSRVVVFGYSVDFSVMHELKKNLAVLKSGKSVDVIERF